MSKNKGKTAEELLQEALVPVEEQLYPIPENWVWTKIHVIAEVKGGRDCLRGMSLLRGQLTMRI